MDGIKKDSRKQPIIIAATNFVDRLDPAIKRPGRFDSHIEVRLPTEPERVLLLRKEFGTRELSPDISVETLAGRMDGWSPAEIKGCVDAVKRKIFKESAERPRPITMTDLTPEVQRMNARKGTTAQ
jgi:ATP-dependent 26S proteasome regulatory subunit